MQNPSRDFETPIHAAIETHAVQRPQAIALTFQEQQLTYADLNQRANQLAHYLIQSGVKAGVAVAVCLEPSLDAIVSLLGVFKAGGVYVPLDPGYPRDRLSHLIAETQAQVVLTHAHLLPILPTGIEPFCVDHDWDLIQFFSSHNPTLSIALDQTAYLIYTSGTTGQPKGVMVSYGNLTHYIRVAQQQFGFSQHDIMPAVARFSFSITFFELLSPLVAGGQLVLLEREHILDFDRMVQTLKQVTVIHTSPSLMKKLVAHIQETQIHPQEFHHLRHVSCGGDMVPADLLATMKTVFHKAEIHVIYGCSEISCMGCTYQVPDDRPVIKTRIGKPFSNTQVRLYDPQQNSVPIGSVGEIYIGGAGVAQGYWQRDALTQERFVTIAGERFYRTGDLGRFDTDGNLEMLGRNDFQIQLRGMRIEPGEIEATLCQSPGVREAVVVAREVRGELAIVAYVVLDQPPPTIASLRQFLQSKLPDYMIPAIFVPLASLPLTPNGKIDRRSLPSPEQNRSVDATDFVAPQTPLEQAIAEIWIEILGLPAVGIQDDFFALGGHSLLATQVVYRLRSTLKVEIAIRHLFEYPTIAALAGYLAPAWQARSQQPDPTEHTDPAIDVRFQPIVATDRTSDSPLAITQSNLWFLSQLEEEGQTLNIPLAFTLRGELDVAVLERSLSEMVRRHETLRTVFPLVNAAPVQRVLPASPFRLTVVDLQSLAAIDREDRTYQLAQAAAQHSFNLAIEIPLYVVLVRQAATESVLLVTIHHIAADGWSLGVFWQELAALYTAYSQGAASPLPELPIQYADFVQWQQQWLTETLLSQQLSYWKQQLLGAPPLLELRTDRPRPLVPTFVGGTVFFTLDATLTAQLKTLSQRTGSTLFMTLLTGLATLLSRYSGQSDLVIGSPIANRHHPALESLIGCFINLLALRIDLQGDPNFLTLLQRVRQMALEAYANQDVPFGEVVEAVQPKRDRTHSPLFQVMFVFQSSPVDNFTLPGFAVSPLRVERGMAQYDLMLMMEETIDGLHGEFEYNGDLFDRGTIHRLVEHFQTLLQAIVAEPAQSVATLPLLSPEEQRQIVQLGKNPMPLQMQNLCLHQQFEAQVRRTPKAIALVSETQQLTYRELNQQANQLARHLQTLGVGPEVLVALVLDRSIDLIVSILAVLKAGGAYVPVDPAYSSERQTYQLVNSQATVILTQANRVATLPSEVGQSEVGQVVAIEQLRDRLSQYSPEDLPVNTTPENLAYIIYTSGSTGTPKGVMIMHQSVVNHCQASVQAYELTAVDRVLQFSSMGFDVFVEEVFPTLTCGATLVLRSEEIVLSIRAFCQFVQHHQITVLNIPTAFWHELVNGLALLQVSLPDSIRLVVVGGEKASRAVYQQWLHLAPSHVRWLNGYGPTEATVTATLFDPRQSTLSFDAEIPFEIPIGRAIANLETYILDAHLQPVPIGIPGELHIGGVGLARGYLHLPEQSQEKFIPHPFDSDPAARLYKTGDIAYYLPDGNIAFIGRRDYQVKIRGFRVELGEIETCLEQHPAVQQTVVLVKEDFSGTKSLAAYVVTPEPHKLTAQELNQFLQPKLPAYMLPSAYVVLESLPLTANGKVDRSALPAPQPVAREPMAANVPADELDRRLIQIWETVLGVQPIAPDDDFFALGGHSLLSIQLFAQIEKALGVALPPTLIFQFSTVQQLASLLRRSSQSLSQHAAIVIQEGNHTAPPLFCIHVLGPNCQFFRPLAAHLNPAQPVYGLAAQMTDREKAPPNRITDLAAYYIKEMQRIQPHGPYHLAGVSFGGCVAFEMACQLAAQGESVALLGLLDTYAPNVVDTRLSVARISSHFDRLKKIGPVYVLKRFKAKLKSVRDKTLVKYSHLLQKAGYSLSYELRFLMVLEENKHAEATYKPKIYPGCVTLFRATENVFYSQGYLDAGLGWRDLADRLQIHDVPGDHMRMLEEPNVQTLAKYISRYLSLD